MAKRNRRVTEQVTVTLRRGGEVESKTTLVTSAELRVGDLTLYVEPGQFFVQQAEPTREYDPLNGPPFYCVGTAPEVKLAKQRQTVRFEV